jgi:xanthine dehydrogenase accessory factor
MKEIAAEVMTELQAGHDFALVRLVAEQGSTPRRAGAEMLVRRDGSIAGTIGGGLLEAAMMRKAGEALDAKRSEVTSMGLRGTDVASPDEMICGGAAQVLIAYVAPGDPVLAEVCVAVREAAAAKRRAKLFTVLPVVVGEPVEFCLLGDDDTLIGAQLGEPASLRKAVGKIAVHGSARLADGREVLVEALELPATAIICGAGHVGRALAPVAARAGWRTVVLDDREEFADPRLFPGTEVVLLSSFEGALSRVAVDEHSYVVIVTRGHTHDMIVLEQALRTPARYVGLMASRTKRKRIADSLREVGFNDEALARVHSPVGLQIGAETPAELAISIVAEMIQVRAGKDA